ncbi:MAG: hypothetical protein ACREOU_16355, partial [Candidatus Eiseniibacteriota bacterium]
GAASIFFLTAASPSVRANARVLGRTRKVRRLQPFTHLLILARDHIVIDESNTANTHNEVTVIGGASVNDAGGALLPRISDSGRITQLVNSMWRMRLPRLTTAEVTALALTVEGDVVFDRTQQKVFLFTGSSGGWREIALGPPI